MAELGGLLVARWTLTAMAAPAGRPGEMLSLALDTDMLLVAPALSLATGLLFGLFPALHSTRPNLVSALKANAGQPSGAKAAARFRITLATAQIALSMALLVSAGLFTKSLANIARVDLGPEHRKARGVWRVSGDERVRAERSHRCWRPSKNELRASRCDGCHHGGPTGVRRRVGERLQLPGVTADPDTDTQANYNFVGTDYLRTLGIPLLAGREITRADTRELAESRDRQRSIPQEIQLGRDAVGKRMSGAGEERSSTSRLSAWRRFGLRRGEGRGEAAGADSVPAGSEMSAHAFLRPHVRSEDDLLTAIPRVIRDIDPTLPVAGLRTMAAQVNENVSLDRFVTSMSAAFAASPRCWRRSALRRARLHGDAAHREFGLRMALGADAANVRRWCFGRSADDRARCRHRAGGRARARPCRRIAAVPDERARPVRVRGRNVALTAVALCAGLIPARRASRVDPMTALRYE